MRWLFRIVLFITFGAAAFPTDAAPSVEIPFEFHDGFIWLRVSTPFSAQPLNFLLDTGASASVLDLAAARRLGLTLAERVSVRARGA